MKYIKIKGATLTEVLGAKAARNMNLAGVEFKGGQQIMKDQVSYGIIYDESKFNIEHPAITYFNSLEEMNADMDLEEPTDEYVLADALLLQLDLQMSGKSTVDGYDSKLPLTSQENLKIIKDSNMDGVAIKPKCRKFEMDADIKLKALKDKEVE